MLIPVLLILFTLHAHTKVELEHFDRSNDGMWDEEVHHFPNLELFMRKKLDRYHSGKIDEVQEFKMAGETIVVITKVGNARDVSFYDKGEMDICQENPVFDAEKSFGNINLEEFQWNTASSGLRIDYRCAENFSDYRSLFETSLRQGKTCLKELHSISGRKSSGASENLTKLKLNLEDKGPLTIVCSDSEKFRALAEKGTRAKGYASVGPESNSGALKHPYLMLNPELSTIRPVPFGKKLQSDEEIKALVFHEALHTLGYRHGKDIEYPYACEECCFTGKYPNEEAKKIACQICTGGYTSAADLNYLKDMVEWGRVGRNSTRQMHTMRLIKKEMLLSKNKKELLFLAAQTGGIMNITGLGAAVEYERLYGPLSGEEKRIIGSIRSVIDQGGVQAKNMPLMSIVSKGFMLLYHDKDPDKALAYYSRLKPSDFPKVVSANGSSDVPYDILRKDLMSDLSALFYQLRDPGKQQKVMEVIESFNGK